MLLTRRLVGVSLATLLVTSPAFAQRVGGPPQPQPPQPLRFRWMGPAPAGRIAAVAGIAGDPLTFYAGAASGGVWKTADGGKTFEPVFDDQPVQAIGALAIAPSDPRVVWAGTGEAWAIRPSDVMGDGVYKSIDAGATWKNVGLKETGRIARILVHPTNPQIVFVCALGRITGPQQERGVFRTRNGGETWDRVLFVNADSGCSGISMDAKDPDVLLAGTWQVVMHTWGMFSGGDGSGVYVTRDGGTKWTRADHPGLPRSPVGKIDVAIAPSDSRRYYALIQTADQGSLWRSDDAGASWRVVSRDRTLIGRAGYYINLKVNPGNADEVLVANSSFHRSTDGGRTFPLGGGCGDCHDIWLDPTNPDRWMLTDDAGMSVTTNHGQNYTNMNLPIGQMYHVAVDNRMPYWIYSNRQDDGTMRGPSDSPIPVANVPSYAPQPAAGAGGRGAGRGGGRGGGGGSAWDAGIGGCESGFTLPDVNNPDIVWASCYGNEVTRFDARAGRARSISPWIHTLDSEPNKTKYRCHWTPPLVVDPFDTKTVYYGCQVIFRTSNEGQSWEVISPDLSTQDPSKIVPSGGIIGDNLGQFAGALVFAIAPSSIQRGLLWAGTNDGKVWYTKDAGKNWTDVTKNIAGMPAWGTVVKIEPSVFDASTAYVAVDYHLVDNRDPFIYRTSDFGQTWTKISGGLPAGHALSYVLSFAENPNRRGMLFAGTGNGFYYTVDDGRTWTAFKDGLPAAPVTWIVVQKTYHDVVVSTYGRGLYILGDISRLEQADRVPTDAQAFLYAPRAGLRQARNGTAELLFSLDTAPAAPVQFEILEGTKVIRTFTSPGRAGLNRAVWDLRYDPPRQVALRTVAPDNPDIWTEPRFSSHDTRPIEHWGIQQPQRNGPIAAPGQYIVRMTVGGQALTQPLEVLKDMMIPSSDADLAASTRMQIRIRDDMNAAVETINRLEVIRKQIEDQLKAVRGRDDLEKSLRDLDRKILDVELRLLSKTDLHSDDKWYVEAYKVYMNLIWLNGVVGTGAGDVAGGADYRPTDASAEVLAGIEKELAAAQAACETLVSKDIPAFNKAMGSRLKPIVTGGQ